MAKNDSAGAFQTHANYLRAFSLIASGGGRDLLTSLRSTRDRTIASEFLPEDPCPNADIKQAISSLQNAWGTELLLNVGLRMIHSDELIRLSNNWSVVQAYYVLYHATQALTAAKGQTRPDNHPKIQNQFYSFLAKRGVGLEPWTLAFGASGPENVPNAVDIDGECHPWVSCNEQSCWSLAYKVLRTTREEALRLREKDARKGKRKQKRDGWEKDEKERAQSGKKPRIKPSFSMPNLMINEKHQIDQKLRPYTLIDYLYRLRIRTNYEDSAMFTDGPINDSISDVVRNDLQKITACSLLVFELHVRPLLKKTVFDKAVTDWISTNAPFEHPIGVGGRRDLHKTI